MPGACRRRRDSPSSGRDRETCGRETTSRTSPPPPGQARRSARVSARARMRPPRHGRCRPRCRRSIAAPRGLASSTSGTSMGCADDVRLVLQPEVVAHGTACHDELAHLEADVLLHLLDDVQELEIQPLDDGAQHVAPRCRGAQPGEPAAGAGIHDGAAGPAHVRQEHDAAAPDGRFRRLLHEGFPVHAPAHRRLGPAPRRRTPGGTTPAFPRTPPRP